MILFGTYRAGPITVENSADFCPTGDFTVEIFRVKFAALGTQRLYGCYDTSGNQRCWVVMYNSGTGELWFNGSTTGGSPVQIVYAWTPTVGTEYDIAVDRSGSTVRLYINGVKVASGTISGALYSSTAPLMIGAGRTGSTVVETFTGTAKAVRFKDSALYATDTSYTVPSLPLPAV